MRLNFSVPVIALVAGAALGYCLAPAPERAEGAAPDVGGEPRGMIADAGQDGVVAALKRRIKDLESQLAEAARAKAQNEELVAGDGARKPEMPQSPKEFFERLKREDPARYAQMTNGMARFRQHRLRQAQSKLDFFSSIDTSFMDSAAKADHDRLVEAIARREEIEERIHDETLSDEAREDVMREMFELDRETRQLNRRERQALLSETVRELGFADDDANAITDTIAEIIDATEGGFGGPPPRGPGGPGGRPPAP